MMQKSHLLFLTVEVKVVWFSCAVDILIMVVLVRKYVSSWISSGVNYFFIGFLFLSHSFHWLRACLFG